MAPSHAIVVSMAKQSLDDGSRSLLGAVPCGGQGKPENGQFPRQNRTGKKIRTYAQNSQINNGRRDIGSREVKDVPGTLLFADTDGWDSCLYPDSETGANVCYRHSGGNEKSTETDRGVSGQKKGKGRANGVFVDTHVETRRAAPKRLFTLEAD
jgi:prepilin-type processing-associated H-X9-DG protein